MGEKYCYRNDLLDFKAKGILMCETSRPSAKSTMNKTVLKNNSSALTFLETLLIGPPGFTYKNITFQDACPSQNLQVD